MVFTLILSAFNSVAVRTAYLFIHTQWIALFLAPYTEKG